MSYVCNKTDPPRTTRPGPTFYRHPEGTAFPNSKRIYITGTQPGVCVPMREIQLSPTLIGGSKEQPQYEENEAIPVYDTSGPYGDPQIAINVQQGLAKLRQPWIDARGDTEELTVRSSDYTKARLADDGLDELRFSGLLTPKRAKTGRRVTQLHYARQASSPRKWNSSPSARIWAASASVAKFYATSIRE